jgi:hypothetical protein
MAYVPVTRVITVEFVRDGDQTFHIVVTPERAEMRYKDTVVWNVQGLPATALGQVGVGNFVNKTPAASVKFANKKMQAVKARKFPVDKTRKSLAAKVARVTLELKQAVDLGVYKYDILYDGRAVVDPELEIRGPKN